MSKQLEEISNQLQKLGSTGNTVKRFREDVFQRFEMLVKHMTWIGFDDLNCRARFPLTFNFLTLYDVTVTLNSPSVVVTLTSELS